MRYELHLQLISLNYTCISFIIIYDVIYVTKMNFIIDEFYFSFFK